MCDVFPLPCGAEFCAPGCINYQMCSFRHPERSEGVVEDSTISSPLEGSGELSCIGERSEPSEEELALHDWIPDPYGNYVPACSQCESLDCPWGRVGNKTIGGVMHSLKDCGSFYTTAIPSDDHAMPLNGDESIPF